MADTNKTGKETSDPNQLRVLFEEKEVHCAGCKGGDNCSCGKKQ